MALKVDIEASPADAERNWPSDSPELETLEQEQRLERASESTVRSTHYPLTTRVQLILNEKENTRRQFQKRFSIQGREG